MSKYDTNSGCVFVVYDYAPEYADSAVLMVGYKKSEDAVEIINAFAGDEAKELWKKLTVWNNDQINEIRPTIDIDEWSKNNDQT